MMTTAQMTKMQCISEQDVGAIDKISNLPSEMIHYIMEFMPVLDAARTCVLSHKWKYIWANHSRMNLDNNFWNSVKDKRASGIIDYANIGNSIIFHHIGNIKEFTIDISNMTSEQHDDVHMWMLYVCTRGLKSLSVQSSISNPYIVPSCVFSASDLTFLRITHCILKTDFGAVCKLETLILEHVTLPSCVLTLSNVTLLVMEHCLGILGFNISIPNLEQLFLLGNDDIALTPYLTCKNIKVVCIFSRREKINRHESIHMMKLFQSWPEISDFAVDVQCLEYLASGVVPNKVPFSVKLTRFTVEHMTFAIDEIAWVLWILNNSRFLESFNFSACWLGSPTANHSEAIKYLEELSIPDQSMKQLQTVRMMHFNGSEVEIKFAKFLLRHAPFLEEMHIRANQFVDPNERLRIVKELNCLQRTSPKVRIIFKSPIMFRS